MYNEFSEALESSFLLLCFTSSEIIIVRLYALHSDARFSPNLYLIKTCNTYIFSRIHASVVQAKFKHLNTSIFFIFNQII